MVHRVSAANAGVEPRVFLYIDFHGFPHPAAECEAIDEVFGLCLLPIIQ